MGQKDSGTFPATPMMIANYLKMQRQVLTSGE